MKDISHIFTRILAVIVLAGSAVLGGLGACGGLLGVPCNGDDPGCNADLYLLQFLAAARINTYATHMYVVDNGGTVHSFTVDRTTGMATAGAQLSIATNPERGFVNRTGDYLYIGNLTGTTGLFGYSLVADPAQPVALNGGTPYSGGSQIRGLAQDLAGDRLYSVVIANQAEGYAIDATTGAVTTVAGTPFGASCVQAIGYSQASNVLYVMQNFPAQYRSFSLDAATGTPVAGAITTSTGFTPSRLQASPDGSLLFGVSIGTSATNVYAARINAADGSLAEAPGSPFAFGATNQAGFDLDLSSDGGLLYATNTSTHAVQGYSVDRTTGVLTPLSGFPITTPNSPRAIKVSPDDNYVYVGNTSGVTVYSLAKSGALTEVGTISGPAPADDIIFRTQSELLF